LSELVHFDFSTKCAPTDTVFLNVFDLASSMTFTNALLNNTLFSTFGVFHAAVEVYGEEWSFYKTVTPSSCGVCKSLRPRHHPVHVYRQSIHMGETRLKEWEVRYLIRGKLATKWPGGGYDLFHRNCIHFCDELLLSLGVRGVPPWVRALHEAGGSVFRVPWPLSMLTDGDGIRTDDESIVEAAGEYAQVETTSVAVSGSTFDHMVVESSATVISGVPEPPMPRGFGYSGTLATLTDRSPQDREAAFVASQQGFGGQGTPFAAAQGFEVGRRSWFVG